MQLARQVWLRRNKWVHEGVFIDPNIINQKIEELAKEYIKINEQGSARRVVGNIDHEKKWLAPPQGWHKVNWDVAIDKTHEREGIGVVIREEKWQVLTAMSKTRLGLLEPTTGEAYAAYHAASLCRDLGLQHISLEGDAKQIVEAVNSPTNTWSRFGHLIDDTWRILLSFSRCYCSFIHHEVNEAIHRLARVVTTDVSD